MDQKNYLMKVDGNAPQKNFVDPFGHFGFCRWCARAPGASRLVFEFVFTFEAILIFEAMTIFVIVLISELPIIFASSCGHILKSQNKAWNFILELLEVGLGPECPKGIIRLSELICSLNSWN